MYSSSHTQGRPQRTFQRGQNFTEVSDTQYSGGRNCGKGEFGCGTVALIIFTDLHKLQHNFQQRILLIYRNLFFNFPGGQIPPAPFCGRPCSHRICQMSAFSPASLRTLKAHTAQNEVNVSPHQNTT